MSNSSDYSGHVLIVAWINIVFSVLFAFVGLFGFFFLTGIGVISEDPEAVRVLGFIGMAAAVFFMTMAIPGLAAGYGLLKRRPWGRILGIVVAVLDLLNFPIGTGIGIYSLWVLSREEATTYFGGAASTPENPLPVPAAPPTPPASGDPGA